MRILYHYLWENETEEKCLKEMKIEREREDYISRKERETRGEAGEEKERKRTATYSFLRRASQQCPCVSLKNELGEKEEEAVKGETKRKRVSFSFLFCLLSLFSPLLIFR